MAVKMLAAERVASRLVNDDENPTHYENRLSADVGPEIGLNAADIRRAELDTHALRRFPRFLEHEKQTGVKRCRELFDVDAFLKAFVAELSSFSASSSTNSMPFLFLKWAADNLAEKHVVFDEETCTKVEVGEALAVAIIEFLFTGQTAASETDIYRGTHIRALFCRADGSKPRKNSEQVRRLPTTLVTTATDEAARNKPLQDRATSSSSGIRVSSHCAQPEGLRENSVRHNSEQAQTVDIQEPVRPHAKLRSDDPLRPLPKASKNVTEEKSKARTAAGMKDEAAALSWQPDVLTSNAPAVARMLNSYEPLHYADPALSTDPCEAVRQHGKIQISGPAQVTPAKAETPVGDTDVPVAGNLTGVAPARDTATKGHPVLRSMLTDEPVRKQLGGQKADHAVRVA